MVPKRQESAAYTLGYKKHPVSQMQPGKCISEEPAGSRQQHAASKGECDFAILEETAYQWRAMGAL